MNWEKNELNARSHEMENLRGLFDWRENEKKNERENIFFQRSQHWNFVDKHYGGEGTRWMGKEIGQILKFWPKFFWVQKVQIWLGRSDPRHCQVGLSFSMSLIPLFGWGRFLERVENIKEYFDFLLFVTKENAEERN